jgi:hypothetical protein
MSENFAAPLNTAAHSRQTHDAHGRSASDWSAAGRWPFNGGVERWGLLPKSLREQALPHANAHTSIGAS